MSCPHCKAWGEIARAAIEGLEEAQQRAERLARELAVLRERER